MIRALVATIADATYQALLDHAKADLDLTIIGNARNEAETLSLVQRRRPDLLLLEAAAPSLDALEITREVMKAVPTPVVILSDGSSGADIEASMHALRAGALAIARIPACPAHDDGAGRDGWKELFDTAKAMAQVKLVRRWAPQRRARPSAKAPSCRILAVAASTGGPAALQQIFGGLPGDFPLPILLVQHITPGFVQGFVRWLDSTCALEAKLAANGQPISPGTIHVAPDDCQFGIDAQGTITLTHAPPLNGFRPSADVMLESVARSFGPAAMAVILTGMGQDGVEGARAVRAAGGRVIAQDEASSVVFGMNRATIEAGLADLVLPLSAIAPRLRDLASISGDFHGADPGC